MHFPLHQTARQGLQGSCGTPGGPIRNSYSNCEEVMKAGFTDSGIYYLDIDGPGYGKPPFEVYCDLTSHAGDSPKGSRVNL